MPPTPSGWELYDLVKDPFEMQNVYNHPYYTDVVQTMKARLREIKDEIGDSDTKYEEMLLLEDGLYHEG
jgi:hypothetical protein